jgi:chromosome segregation ATPase
LIEQAMIFALGFLVAALLSLLFLPAVQRRAARLASRRLEMLLPLSMEEIVAERDQLRAEFAVERRRLEQRLEEAAETQAQRMGEYGRQAAALDALRSEHAKSQEELRAIGEARDALHNEKVEAEAALAAAEASLEEERHGHGTTREALDALRAQHAALEQVANERRAGLAGLETRAAALDLRILALNHQKEELERNLQSKISEAEVLQVERDLARTERDGLETTRATLQRRLDEEALRAADLRDQIEELRRRLDEAQRARVAGETVRDNAQRLHTEASSKVQEQEHRIREIQSAAAERHAKQTAEIATLTGALESARAEITRLQQERREPRQESKARRSDAEQAPGREETALVRQAIADLGAEVLKIAETLKTPATPQDDTGGMPAEMVGRASPRSRARAQP